MPGQLLHVNAAAMCPHGGQMTVVPSQTRVLVGGQPVATMADTYLIAGCPFAPVKAQPCVTVRWLVPATRVRVMGQPVILTTSTGLAHSAEQIPQGAPVVTVVQSRVRGI